MLFSVKVEARGKMLNQLSHYGTETTTLASCLPMIDDCRFGNKRFGVSICFAHRVYFGLLFSSFRVACTIVCYRSIPFAKETKRDRTTQEGDRET